MQEAVGSNPIFSTLRESESSEDVSSFVPCFYLETDL